MKYLVNLVFFSIALNYVASTDYDSDDSDTIVQTKYGLVQGEKMKNVKDGSCYKKYIIRYGEAKRFEEAKPCQSWDGVYKPTTSYPICPQIDSSGSSPKVIGNEDCLYLTLYVPCNITQLKPVMVFIHGGGYELGSMFLYSGELLIGQDVVYVAMNYRLGALGFCYDKNDDSIGRNLGLKDQQLALKWVNENIKNFGGNPDSVTIFGESAGAASVCFHLANPESSKYFKSAIMESGTCCNGWSYKKPDKADSQFKSVRERAGCSKSSNPNECMRTCPVENIISNQGQTADANGLLAMFQGEIFCNVPTSNNSFTPEDPCLLLKKGKFDPSKTIVVGYNDLEAKFLDQIIKSLGSSGQIALQLLPQMLCGLAMPHIKDELNPITKLICTEILRANYLNGSLTITSKNMIELFQFISDTMFFYPTAQTLYYCNQYSPNVFAYINSYNGSYALTSSKDYPGVGHGDELYYIFPMWQTSEYYSSVSSLLPDESFSEKIIKFWTNVAYTGKPGGDWPPYNYKDPKGYHFKLGLQDDVQPVLSKSSLTCWKNICKTLNCKSCDYF